MHINDVVISIVDSKNKPLREYGVQRIGNDRKCDVFAPVDTEYKFLIKNNTDRRIKVNIDIDGSAVSGNGLILGIGESDYIERFVDIDRKFKTSLKTGDGVADPTSLENGIIKVRVHKENIKLPIMIVENHYHYDINQTWPTPYTWSPKTVYYCGIDVNKSFMYGNITTHGADSAWRMQQGAINSMAYSCNVDKPAEILATVEGSKSNQIFATTVWNGDDLVFGESVFTFYLKLASVVDPEFEQYLKLKEKFGNK